MFRMRDAVAVLVAGALLLSFFSFEPAFANVKESGEEAASAEEPKEESAEEAKEKPSEGEEEEPEAQPQGFCFPSCGGGTPPFEPAIGVEHLTRQGVEERLSPDGVNLMGDQVDMNTGALTFEHTDVSLPGNSKLPVAFTRRIGQGETDHNTTAVMADWSIETPRITIMSPVNNGNPAGWADDLCSLEAPLPVFVWVPNPQNPDPSLNQLEEVREFEYSNGLNLTVPGRTSSKVLYDIATPGMWPSGTIRVTSDYWALKCTTTTTGEDGFIAIAPNGDQYKFDRYFTKDATVIPISGTAEVERKRVILMASEVTDVNGNWVKYDYNSSGELTKIHANDGREITVQYTSGRVSSITANSRVWDYSYATVNGQVRLTDVELPDGRSWEYSLAGMTLEPSPAYGSTCNVSNVTVSLTHPNGADGTFVLAETRHLKGVTSGIYTTVSQPCSYGGGDEDMFVPFFDALSVISKNIAGPGYSSATWTYSYLGWTGSMTGPYPDLKWGEETDPTGRKIRSYFHRAGDLEGLIESREIRNSSNTLMETTEYDYVVEAAVGETYLLNENMAKMTKPRHVEETVITRGSDVYTTENTYNNNHASSTYSYGNPIEVQTSSNVVTGVREVDVTYEHNKTKWILGLPKTVTRNSKLFDEYVYDANGRPTTHKKFGTTWNTFTYSTVTGEMGALHTVTDAASEVITFSNYKRGLPQTIIRKDGEYLYRTVDDNGWVTSETDGNGWVTGYDYNSVGWLTEIDRPFSYYYSTTFSYSWPGGALLQTATRGTQATKTWYDSLSRPYRVQREALSGGGGSVYVRTIYDKLGRVIFESFPSTAFTPTEGTETEYDALGRPVSVAENVSPYAETEYEYLSSNRTRVTDPANYQTTTWASGYGSPDDGDVIKMVDDLGTTTEMDRDIYGKITQLSQSGTQNGYTASVTRNFYYNARELLCRHDAPETGGELFEYDVMDRPWRVAKGQPTGSGCNTPPAADRVIYSYDELGQLTYVNYPSGTPDIATVYDDNGNVLSVTRGSIVWAYQYDALNQIKEEKLTLDGRTYEFDYGFTREGFVSWRERAAVGSSGLLRFDFNPNGLGQPKAVRNSSTYYLSSAAYHPNGTLSTLDYGNGLELTQNLNARQLVSVIRHHAGTANTVRLFYGYEARGKIDAITDDVVPNADRTFSYDAIGRLAGATSEDWGAASYKYDALNNIRDRDVGGRTVDIAYNGSNQVASVTDTANPYRAFAHDDRGNVTNDGRYTFVYDHADQPTSVSDTGGTLAAYTYDGNKKRVKQVVNGKTSYFVYSAVTGGLIFKDDVTDTKATDYASIGPASVRIENGSTPVYTHADHLGSPVAATDAPGTLLWRESYLPFGEKLLSPAGNADNTGYTGHVEDAVTGLTYMQARYFDPIIGRFYSTDPIDYQDQLNLYAYVHNDPVNATDPTGMCSSISDEDVQADCYDKRADAVESAKEELSDESVRSGKKEAAYIATYNEDTGEVTERTGDTAGKRTGSEVAFTDNDGNQLVARPDGRIVQRNDDGSYSDTNEVVLATGHSHPKENRGSMFARSNNRDNESIRGNDTDQALSRVAPAVIKTPSGKIKVYVNGEEQ